MGSQSQQSPKSLNRFVSASTVTLLKLQNVKLKLSSNKVAEFQPVFSPHPAPRSGGLWEVLLPLRTQPSDGAASSLQPCWQCPGPAKNHLLLHLAGDQVTGRWHQFNLVDLCYLLSDMKMGSLEKFLIELK